MLNNNNSVLVTAPTGAAAHNVGGQTIHREFKINVGKKKHKYDPCEPLANISHLFVEQIRKRLLT